DRRVFRMARQWYYLDVGRWEVRVQSNLRGLPCSGSTHIGGQLLRRAAERDGIEEGRHVRGFDSADRQVDAGVPVLVNIGVEPQVQRDVDLRSRPLNDDVVVLCARARTAAGARADPRVRWRSSGVRVATNVPSRIRARADRGIAADNTH